MHTNRGTPAPPPPRNRETRGAPTPGAIEMALDRLMAQAERDGDDIQLGLLKEMREAGQTALDRTIGRPTQRSENLHAHAHGAARIKARR